MNENNSHHSTNLISAIEAAEHLSYIDDRNWFLWLYYDCEGWIEGPSIPFVKSDEGDLLYEESDVENFVLGEYLKQKEQDKKNLSKFSSANQISVQNKIIDGAVGIQIRSISTSLSLGLEQANLLIEELIDACAVMTRASTINTSKGS